MLKPFLHQLVGMSWVYDFTQTLAGASKVREKIAKRINAQTQFNCVLDLGGGTGAFKKYLFPRASYICVDIDERKLAGFKKQNPIGNAVIANGCSLPFPARHLDSVILMSVLHHLDDGEINLVFYEVQRILNESGRVYILDPVWNQNIWIGKWLWKYDRGSFPRLNSRVMDLATQNFGIAYYESFRFFHEYIFLECTKL